jgi:hypothetical protein
MKIYIDEAGGFVHPSAGTQSYSLVLALVIPSSIEDELFHEFLCLRDSWPKQAIEIKGSTLDEAQAAQVIELMSRYDVLVNFFSVDMVMHDDQAVEAFKNRQADKITVHITREYLADAVQEMHELGEAIRRMPNQLFLQADLTIRLLLKVIQNSTLYFAQLRPDELGSIEWIIDRKNRTLTEMEQVWTTLILPFSEQHFHKNSFVILKGADYSHFLGRYGFTAETMDEDMARHLKWAEATYGAPPLTGDEAGTDSKLLFSEQRRFEDSKNSLGLQLADMLAAILRRGLNENLQLTGWRDFGRLFAGKSNPFVLLYRGDGSPRSLEGHTAKVCRVIMKQSKSLLVTRKR